MTISEDELDPPVEHTTELLRENSVQATKALFGKLVEEIQGEGCIRHRQDLAVLTGDLKLELTYWATIVSGPQQRK